MTIHLDGPSPDRGPAPAYRLAPDTPAEIAADLARLCAGPGQSVLAMGILMAAEPARCRDGNNAPRRGHDDHDGAARAGDTATPASVTNGLAPISAAESTAPARGRAIDGSRP